MGRDDELARRRGRLLDRFAVVEKDLHVAHLNRTLYRAMRDEVTTRWPQADGTFFNSYRNLYAAGQMMVIRRLADADARNKPNSLWWVIERIRRDPQVAARRHWLDIGRETHAEDAQWLAAEDAEFTDKYGPGETPDDAVLAGYQASLLDAVTMVTNYVDRNVAHNDPRGHMHTVTYDYIDAALDHVTDTANLVSALLTRVSTAYDHIIITGDWQEAFRPALFPLPIETHDFPDPCGYS